MRLMRLSVAVVGVILTFSTSALAIEDFDKGKSPAELFRTNCGICHRSPQGLGQSMSQYALTGFLTVHYTASRQIAGAIAGYLTSLRTPPAKQRQRDRSPRRKRSGSSDRGPAATVASGASVRSAR